MLKKKILKMFIVSRIIKWYKEVLQILRVLIVDFRNNFFSHRCYDLNLNTKVKIESYIG